MWLRPPILAPDSVFCEQSKYVAAAFWDGKVRISPVASTSRQVSCEVNLRCGHVNRRLFVPSLTSAAGRNSRLFDFDSGVPPLRKRGSGFNVRAAGNTERDPDDAPGAASVVPRRGLVLVPSLQLLQWYSAGASFRLAQGAYAGP